MKWYGDIAYSLEVEKEPGIIENEFTIHHYYGDIVKNYKMDDSAEWINDNINISNQISVVADPFAFGNFHRIAYVTFMGNKWRVKSVDVQYPRLIISIGGIYNMDYEEDSGCGG